MKDREIIIGQQRGPLFVEENSSSSLTAAGKIIKIAGTASATTAYGNHLKGHIGPAVLLGVTAFWWLINIAYRHYAAPYNGRRYTSAPNFPVQFLCERVRSWPIEGYVRLIAVIFGAVYDTTNVFSIFPDFTSYLTNPHSLMLSVFGLSGVISILHHHKVPLPAHLEHAMLGVSLLNESLLLKLHLSGRLPIDVMIHSLVAYLAFVGACVIFVEIAFPHSYPISFARCYILLFHGTWFGHVGDINDYEDRHMGWVGGQEKSIMHWSMGVFVCHGIIDLTACLIVAAFVKFFVWRRRHVIKGDNSECDSDEMRVEERRPLRNNKNWSE